MADETTTAGAVAVDDGADSAPWYVWLGLSAIAVVSFWCQATTTEERFVPALNVIANKFAIPNDVAGATLMAAGASSPELFSSFVALFVTHSSLGLGTIVGSEIFNQLIICAGAIAASKGGYLQLDPAILLREVFFYGLSIVLLYFALQNTGPVPDDDEDHIFISFGQASYVFGGYICYVLVCANMSAVVSFFSGLKPDKLLSANSGAGRPVHYGATDTSVYAEHADFEHIHTENMPFLQQFVFDDHEPAKNFETVQFLRTKTGEKTHADDTVRQAPRPSMLVGTLRRALAYSDGNHLRQMDFLMATEKPTDARGLYDIETNTFEERMSCFMWQRSYFYNKSRFATHGWHLRWFTFQSDLVVSIPNRSHAENYMLTYPVFNQVKVDEKRLIIEMVSPTKSKRSFFFMCPTHEILDKVIKKMDEIIGREENQKKIKEALQAASDASTKESETVEADLVEEGHAECESLIEFPTMGSNTEIVLFLFLFPLRFLMHWTIPDVRVLDSHGNPVGNLGNAFLAVVSCLVWLIIGSYAMVASLEALAALMNVPDAVVGVTVSAAGTSLPNYVASKMAAEQGFGNMAVSNAFGSNTFNIMVGLGLPWFIYTSFGTGFKPYHDLKDEGIGASVFVMMFVLVVFVLLVIPSNFKMYPWHGYLFVALYVAYLAYAIVPEFM